MGKDKIFDEILILLTELNKKNYSFMYNEKYSSRVDEKDFMQVLNKFGNRITIPPHFNKNIDLELIQIKNQPIYGCDFLLWIDNKKSDLTLIMDFYLKDNNEVSKVEINDLRVM